MYVDETVLNFMAGREFESTLMVNETVNATVAFLDICSFTTISENESQDTVVKLLNKYFDVMVKEIIAQGGYIDKFMGDAVMSVFRGDYHLDRAMDACLAVRKKVNELPNESGNIGSANLKRLDYTVIGDVVNVAQRLQAIAKEGQIIISESSYEKVKESFNCNKVGEVNLKNKSRPVMIYEVLD